MPLLYLTVGIMNPLSNVCQSILDSVNSHRRLQIAQKNQPQDGATELRLAIDLSTSDRADRDRLNEEFFAHGPLRPLIEDHEVSEILINGPNAIWL